MPSRCARCDVEMPLQSRGFPRKWCSEGCRLAAYRERTGHPGVWPRSKVSFLNCAACDSLFTTHVSRRWCSPECRKKIHASDQKARVQRLAGDAKAAYSLKKRNDKAVRAARLRAAQAERFDPRDVYERDGWICGICSVPVDRRLRHPDPMSASLDHVTPVSHGGDHTRANTRCSHLVCNTRRGNRAEEAARVA